MKGKSIQLDSIEEVISLAKKIKETRIELQHLIEEWNTKFPNVPIEDAAPRKAKPVVPTPEATTSIDDRIVQHLEANPTRQFNANLLHDELAIPPSSLGTQLSKLYRTNRIERLGKGFYKSIQTK